jgi:hypothetical protein
MAGQQWRVRLGAAAEVDFANILKWTTENFGRDNRAHIGTHWSRRLANESIAPMLQAPRPGTRSRRIFERSTLQDAVGAEAIS